MKSIFLSLIFLSVLFFISCSDSGSIGFTWQGSWLSEENFDERGTFIFNFQIEHEELTGTITIPGMGISDLQIEGEITRDTILMIYVTYIEFSDLNDRMTFTASAGTHEIDSDTKVRGFYVDVARGDSGCWYSGDDSRKDFSSISSFSLDSTILSPDGLCFGGNNLWVLDDQISNIIYKIDPTNGTIIDLFDISEHTTYICSGLAWDGSHIWCLGYNNLCKFDTLGTLITELPNTQSADGDIAYAYGYIWRGHPVYDSLQRINPENGNIEGTYPCPSFLVTGLAFDGNNLWVSPAGGFSEWTAICKIDQFGNVLETYNSPSYDAGALACDGSFLYCVDYINKRIYKLGI